jgi:hypothetical protein
VFVPRQWEKEARERLEYGRKLLHDKEKDGLGPDFVREVIRCWGPDVTGPAEYNIRDLGKDQCVLAWEIALRRLLLYVFLHDSDGQMQSKTQMERFAAVAVLRGWDSRQAGTAPRLIEGDMSKLLKIGP